MKFKDGSVFEGFYADDKKYGKGIFRFINGDIYEGEFKDGLFDG